MLRPRTLGATVTLFPARTPTLPPATHTNSYSIGDREVVLIEPATPYRDELSAWLAWARAIEAEGRTLLGVLATHHHVDHVGGAAVLCRALDLPLLAHVETWQRLPDREGLRWREVHDGERLALDGPHPTEWTHVWTPGHAPGHICLWEPSSRTLVAGDMVANGSTILIPPDDGGDMAEYLVQLRRLDALDAAMVLPAHGEPIDAPRALFAHYVAHRLKREAKVLEAWRALEASLRRAPEIHELVARAYDDTPVHLFGLAALSLRAHLVKLGREGRL